MTRNEFVDQFFDLFEFVWPNVQACLASVESLGSTFTILVDLFYLLNKLPKKKRENHVNGTLKALQSL